MSSQEDSSRELSSRSLSDYLKELGLGQYMSVVYATLLAMGGFPTSSTEEQGYSVKEILKESSRIKDIPPTRIHHALRELEEVYLVKRVKNTYPYRYSAFAPLNYVHDAHTLRKEELEKQIQRLDEIQSEIEKIYRGLIGFGIWDIISRDEAIRVTQRMWDGARKQILLMTEVGRWVLAEEELKEILKKKRDQVQLFVLLTQTPKRSNERGEFEKFLREDIKTTQIYHYPVQSSIRINVVDLSQCLFILTDKDNKGREQSRYYYSTSRRVAYSFSELFYWKCLSSVERIKKLREALPNIDSQLYNDLGKTLCQDELPEESIYA